VSVSDTVTTLVHSDITAAGAVLQCSCAPANRRGTCKWSMGAVPARTSTLNRGLRHSSLLNTLDVRGKTLPWPGRACRRADTCISVRIASTTSWLTGQAATTHTIAITWPHLTLPHTVHFVQVYTRCLLLGGCMSGTLRACSLFPANRTAATLPFGVQSAESFRTFARELVGDRQSLFGSSVPTAVSLIDY